MHEAFRVSSQPIVSNIKDRVESVLIHGNKLFIGCQNGSLHIYTLHTDVTPAHATVDKVVTAFAKKSIEQLGVVKQTNSLVSLSDGCIYLHDLQSLKKQADLGAVSQTKGQAGLFTIETAIRDIGITRATARRSAKGKAAVNDAENTSNTNGQALVTTLAVGCRRRLVLFSWHDEEWQDPTEVALPHQVRSMTFPTSDNIFLGFSTGDYGVVSLATHGNAATLGELFQAPSKPSAAHATTSRMTTGAVSSITGLGSLASKTGGYMGLSSKVDRNPVTKLRNNEVMIFKDTTGNLLDAEGKLSRSGTIEYASQPEEVRVCWPYLLSVLPSQAALTTLTRQQAADPVLTSPSIQIHAIPTLNKAQEMYVPPVDLVEVTARPRSMVDMPAARPVLTARLLTASANYRSPLVVLTQPPENTAVSDSNLWLCTLQSWSDQLTSLVASGSYEEALKLLASLDNGQTVLPDHDLWLRRLKILNGLTLFLDHRKFDQAIDVFIDQDVSAAKVVALFPKTISGKLHCDRKDIEEAWGGRTRAQAEAAESERKAPQIQQADKRTRQATAESAKLDSSSPSSTGWSFSSPMKRRLHADDIASVRSGKSERGVVVEPEKDGNDIHRDDLSQKVSVDVLMRYLPDRRQRILQALANIPPAQRPSPSSPMPSHPSSSASDLLALPDLPLSSYTPAQLQRTAQVVETALFKCYLHAKPGLLGPLCRIENWCEVEEVEELLLEAKKYKELLDLYNGKHMHSKAIALLQRIAEESEDDDRKEKTHTIITYLQKLGPKHLDLILDASKWVIKLDEDAALSIFTADIDEVTALPRHAVLKHLQTYACPASQAKYLSHIITDLGEQSPEFHDKLAGLYFKEVTTTVEQNGEQEAQGSQAHASLLEFLEQSRYYRPDRLLKILPPKGMLQIKAILLGKLGRHSEALGIYVNDLHAPLEAENYCKRIYAAGDAESRDIFLVLLKVHLQAIATKTKDTPSGAEAVFEPVLHLLAAHGEKMDMKTVLELLPPLLTVKELETFLIKSTRKQLSQQRTRKAESKVQRARMDQIERDLVLLHERRVKINDGRVCPMCHKRLGISAIAVHSPRGEVTHYNCKDRWVEANAQGSTAI